MQRSYFVWPLGGACFGLSRGSIVYRGRRPWELILFHGYICCSRSCHRSNRNFWHIAGNPEWKSEKRRVFNSASDRQRRWNSGFSAGQSLVRRKRRHDWHHMDAGSAVAFFLFLAQRLQPISGIPSISPVNIDRARFLGKFGLLSIAAGSTMPLAYIYVRLIVQANVGTEGLSLWQATVRLSEAYTQLPMLMLSVIFFAKFASKSGHKIDWLEVRKTYLFITALMIVIGLSVYALRNYLVEILFTAEFSQVAELLVWQLTGDLLRMMSYVGTTILAARGFLKTGISAEFLQGGLFILVSGVLIPKFGQLGPFVAYIVTYGSYLLFTIMALLYLHARSKNHATINC